MPQERVSPTTTVTESDAALAAAVDSAMTPVSYESVRGTAELGDDFASVRMMKELKFGQDFLKTHDITDLYVSHEEAPVATKTMLGRRAVTTSVKGLHTASEQLVPRETTSKSEKIAKAEKTARSLGSVALAPFRAIGKGMSRVNQAVATFNVEYVSRIPGLDSKEEKLKKMRAREEKYTIRENDSSWTKLKKHIGKNAFKAAAWSMPTAMGLVGGLSLARGIGGITEAWMAGSGGEYHGIADGMPVSWEVKPLVSSRPIDLMIGGHWQGKPDEGYTQSLIDAGIINSDTDDIRAVNWTAQMAPLGSDSLSMQASDMEGAARLVEHVNGAGGAPVRIIAFSQGTQATARAVQELAAQNGGVTPSNIEVIVMGSPGGENGIGGNQAANIADPFLNAAGIETGVQFPPGTRVTYRTDIADVFGNGGNQSLAKLAEQAIGPGHRVIGPENGVLISRRVGADGAVYEIWGDPEGINDPLMRMLRDRGIPITPEANALAEAVLPYGTHETGPAYGTSDGVIGALGPAIDSYTGNSGAGTKSVNAVFADPALRQGLGNTLDLIKVPDLASDAIQHPERAMQDVNQIGAISTGAVNSAIGMANNPDQGIDAANRALEANGLPGAIPHAAEMRQIAGNVGSMMQQVTGVSLPTAPEMPQITPLPGNIAQNPTAIMPTIQSGMNAVTSFLGGIKPPAATSTGSRSSYGLAG